MLTAHQSTRALLRWANAQGPKPLRRTEGPNHPKPAVLTPSGLPVPPMSTEFTQNVHGILWSS